METPRKLYVLVSRKQPVCLRLDVLVHRARAERAAKLRNELREGGIDDWRVEVFVKEDRS